MKTVFTKDGKVVSVCSTDNPNVQFECAVAGAERHVVEDVVKVDHDWAYADEDGRPAFSEPPPAPKRLTRVEFKLCFTPAERVAIKEARKTDAILDDAYEILDDPNLTFVDMGLESTKWLIDRMVTLKLLTATRAAEIKSGAIL